MDADLLVSIHTYLYVCVLVLDVYLIVTGTPIHVTATVLTPRSVQVTWNAIYSSCIIGYLISYFTNASYTTVGSGNIIVDDVNETNYTFTDLEEHTEYTIILHAISDIGIIIGDSSNKVTITTYTDSKYSHLLEMCWAILIIKYIGMIIKKIS